LHGLWSTPLTDRRYRFKDGTAALGAAVPLTGTGNTKTAALATAALAGGTHSLTAVYSGDAYNAGSTTATAVTQTVNKRSSSVALASSANPANFGTSVTLTATVTGFSPSGTMTFKDGSTTLGTGSVLNGAASFNTLGLAAGAHSVTAVYSGDASNLTSTSPVLTQTINATALPAMKWLYGYDPLARPTIAVDPNQQTTLRAYDALDRLTLVNYPTGVDTTLQYDGSATPVQGSIGRLTKVTDESGQTVWAYNTLGQLSTKTQTTSSKVFAVGYGWSSAGGALDKPISITYPSGSRVNYAYDLYGRVSGITVNPVNANGVGVNTGSTVTLLSAISYTPENKVKGWNWSDASARTISDNSFGQISGYSLGKPNGSGIAAGSQRTVVRDNAHQPLAEAQAAGDDGCDRGLARAAGSLNRQ
jgi:YD repeat-containing protein